LCNLLMAQTEGHNLDLKQKQMQHIKDKYQAKLIFKIKILSKPGMQNKLQNYPTQDYQGGI
uniref:hypothetical protein n=1 Tax=Escherichia coli TaxID=562 RepID=UPI00215ACA08